jgi:hypothetical protein
MAKTFLIFTCQISDEHLSMIRTIEFDLHTIKSNLEHSARILDLIRLPEFNGIMVNLNEIIQQANNNEFRFNAYLLKMIIVKFEYIMSQLQVSDEIIVYNIYNKMSKHRIDLICILDELISPF